MSTSRRRPGAAASAPDSFNTSRVHFGQNSADDHSSSLISLFETPLGWIGLWGQNERLVSVFAGYPSADAILNRLQAEAKEPVIKCDWNSPWRQLFEAYAEGDIIDFREIEIQLPEVTRFRQRVIEATRNLGYGQIASYGEVAQRAGFPRAARAVGTVMSTNRFPILIPCHRVLAAGGKIGGYTSPAGIRLKEKLLQLEAKSIKKPINESLTG